MIPTPLLPNEDSGFGAITHHVKPACSLHVSAVLIASTEMALAITFYFSGLCHTLAMRHWACIGDDEGKVQRTCLVLKD